MTNRTLESYIIYLKEDLRIADACKTIKNGLLNAITDENNFSKEMIDYFIKENRDALFSIDANDPTQVVLLKKLINALQHLESIFGDIEHLDINREQWQATILINALPIGLNAVNEIYDALQLINHSNAGIQEIVGPYIQKLLPHVALANKAIAQLNSDSQANSFEETMGAGLGDFVSMLPTEKLTTIQSIDNINKFIFHLPSCFEIIQKKINNNSSEVTSAKDDEELPEDKKAAEKKIELKQFNPISHTHVSSYIRLVNTVIKQSSDILNTAAPLTETAYVEAARRLVELKHTTFPQLIAELETVE